MSDIRVRAPVTSPAILTGDAFGDVRGTPWGDVYTADWLVNHLIRGRVWTASDADQDDRVTAQTSFVNTTPTFLLNVPSGSYAIPLHVFLNQTGTVAGGEISVYMEYDNIAAFASGGTEETHLSSRTDSPQTRRCAVYSNATATAGYGVNIFSSTFVQDVGPAVGDDWKWHTLEWKWSDRGVPILLVGPASFKIFTFAATTAPTWTWSIAFAEGPSSELPGT